MKKSKLSASSQRMPTHTDGSIQKTEWTATAKITEWINSIIKEKNLPLGISEVETKLAGERKRPDIIIYKAAHSDEIICLLEFKLPYYESDDEENLKEPARKKATKRSARYFATSNFQTLILFNTEKVNSMKPVEEQIVDTYLFSTLEDINEIESPKFRSSIYTGLEKFLMDLAEFTTGKKTEPLKEINILLVWRLQEKINRLSRYYKRIIEDECHKNKEFRKQLKNWFTEQKWEFNAQENDFNKAARQTAYLLVNKIVFYNTLQTKRQKDLDPLSIPDDLTKGGLLKKHLQNYFDYVLKNIDYESIYSADFIDSLAFHDIDEAVVTEIRNLVKVLKRYNFSKLGYDIIGYIFEKLIPTEERHNLGQYFTNSNIVDIILRFCLKHEKDKVVDPSCGAGTFLVRAYQHKKLMNSSLTHEEILDSLWGVDIAKFPAHLSTINLAINDLSVDKNYPNIVNRDFFELHSTSQGLELPDDFLKTWRRVRTVRLSSSEREVTYPRYFDCIVGNPPYTRQEEIGEIDLEDKNYKSNLIKNALLDLSGRKMAEISKRSGIHSYFFVHGTKFLKNGGRFGFIVSNSWLDVDYGKGLQEFFLLNYKIIAVIESKVERWFEDADINTCIVILEKCNEGSPRDENLVRFVYLKKRLSDFIPPASEMWEKQKERIDKTNELLKTILFHSEFYENNDLRILPKKQSELWIEGFDSQEHKYVGSKWGKYIRAPEIFFRILEKGKDKFVPLKEVADVRRGFTTGANEFFYLTKNEIEKWQIEKKYLEPIIFSLKEVDGYIVDRNKLSKYMIVCHKTKEKLKGSNLLKYIQYGEKKGFHKRPTSKCREPWYSLGKNWKYAPLIFPAKIGERMPILLNQSIFEDKKLYGVAPKKEENVLILVAMLNSTILRLFVEFTSRQLTGAQAIADIDVAVVENLLFPNLKLVSASIRKKIIESFNKLLGTNAESIFDEIGDSPEIISLGKIKPDRRELDKIVMGDILGLTEEEQLEVYRAVVDLVKSRIEKAKSVNKKKMTNEGIDIDLLVKNVLSHIGEETLGKFYKEKILSQECYEKSLPELDGKIKIEKDLLGWRVSGENTFIKCDSKTEAEYVKNFICCGLSEVKIPKDEKYIKNILPELKKMRHNIDIIIEDDVLSILNPKTQGNVLIPLWQKILD